jgi:enamine deaminase RidA (YjgF/YER057c/UK114 family)
MIEDKLASLGLTLPDPAAPLYHYIPVAVHAGLAYLSGQLPRIEGGLSAAGKVGAEVSLEQAQEAARVCVLNGLACLNQALGSLDAIERVLKLTGFVASAPGFHQQPVVIDAASRLLTDLFGENGRHARSAVGVAELPRNAPVEIEMIVALR